MTTKNNTVSMDTVYELLMKPILRNRGHHMWSDGILAGYTLNGTRSWKTTHARIRIVEFWKRFWHTQTMTWRGYRLCCLRWGLRLSCRRPTQPRELKRFRRGYTVRL